MTMQRTFQVLAEDWPQPAISGETAAHTSQWDFRLVPRAEWSVPLLREITGFLDAEDSSHPFQWPQWAAGGELMAMMRSGSSDENRIQWLAQCGLTYPASRILRAIRALTINRGPVCDDLEVLESGLHKLVEQAHRMKCSYVEIAPEWTGAFAESAREMLARNGWQCLPQQRCSLRLSLKPCADDLMASFRKTTRYEIRRSMAAGIDVSIVSDEGEYQEFHRLYVDMARQRNFPTEKPDFLLSVFRWLASGARRGGLFLARESGTLRGGILVIRSGLRCWYVFGATSKEGKIGAGHLLQWHAIQWAKENGCTEYDFGGYREGATSGPALFKKGFCDGVVHFIAPHRFIVSPDRHRMSEIVGRMRENLRPR